MTDASMRPAPLTRAQAVSIRAECRVTTWPNFIRDVAAANEIAARRFSECDGSLQFEVYSSLPNAREADPSRTPIAWRVGSAVQVRVFFRAEAAAQLVRRLSAGERAVGERAVADEEFEFVDRQLIATRHAIAREECSRAPIVDHQGTPPGDGWMGPADRSPAAEERPDYVLAENRYLRIKQFYEVLALMRESAASTAALQPAASDPGEIAIGPPGALLSGMEPAAAAAQPDGDLEPAPPPPAALDEQEFCSVCMERRCDAVLSCAHAFCNQCMSEWRQSSATARGAASRPWFAEAVEGGGADGYQFRRRPVGGGASAVAARGRYHGTGRGYAHQTAAATARISGRRRERRESWYPEGGPGPGIEGEAGGGLLGGSAPCPLCRTEAVGEAEEWELILEEGVTQGLRSAEQSGEYLLRLQLHAWIRQHGKPNP